MLRHTGFDLKGGERNPMRQFEILSPAGSLETLICAVNNGADAVYIGGREFSARKNAVNFSKEDIQEAVRYAHLYDAKVYVTVNTLVYDSEFKGFYEFIKFLYSAGVDALIIQDLGVLSMVKRCFPDFEVHASTQMTIHNISGARLAKELGFKRVVLSRELTFDEIKNISDNVDIELEVFVHGALCMSYSGQCLMSSFIGGRSGNRGDCAQPCRLPYTLMNSKGKNISNKEKYLLSLKDLCLIDEMKTLMECGVTSLKIEGRMKSAEYVSVVTSIYDKYRDGSKVEERDRSALKSIFSRNGFTQGYLEGNTGRHMLNYDKNNDDVYQNISHDVKELAAKLKSKAHEPIEFHAHVSVYHDMPMTLTVSAKGESVTVEGSINAEQAVNAPLTEERLTSQIAKSGSTPFVLSGIKTDIAQGVSLPVKEINNIRREALSLLEDKLTATLDRKSEIPFNYETPYSKPPKKLTLNAEVRTLEQFEAASKAGFDKILVPYSLYKDNKTFIDESGRTVAVILPAVARDIHPVDTHIISGEIYASNFSQLALCKDRKVSANHNINVFNSHSAEFVKNLGIETVCISPEVTQKELLSMKTSADKEIIVYGRIPLMTVQNCIVKSALGCGCKDEYYLLKDRKGVEFPVITDKNSCTNTIYNSLPVYMADKLTDDVSADVSYMRFVFTTESAGDIFDIYRMYKNKERPSFDFTRGHYFRGV